VEHRTTDWNAALALVGAGLGVTLVPRLAQLAPTPGVRMLELAGDAPARHLIGICRGGAEHAPAVAAVLGALERAAAGPQRAAA
jgi:DNA-binding transcriptional LysR family regulator